MTGTDLHSATLLSTGLVALAFGACSVDIVVARKRSDQQTAQVDDRGDGGATSEVPPEPDNAALGGSTSEPLSVAVVPLELPNVIRGLEASSYKDFEDGGPNGSIEIGGNRIVQTVAEAAFLGEFGARIEQLAPLNQGYTGLAIDPDTSPDATYLRAWVQVSAGTINGTMPFYQDSSGEGAVINFRPSGVLQAEFRSTGETIDSTDGAYPEDEWWCLQAYIRHHPSDGELRAWVNGTEVLSVSGQETAATTVLEPVSLGLHEVSDGQEGALFYIDEIAADPAPIACD